MRRPFLILAMILIAAFAATSVFAEGWQFWKKSCSAPKVEKPVQENVIDKDIPATAKVKMDDIAKYDPKEETAILREINLELESYLPQLKQQNEGLKSMISAVEKENESLKSEVATMRKDKGSAISKSDLDRVENDNARLRGESEELKKQNKALEEKVAKVTKQKPILENALKEQHALVIDEVNQMRTENESLFRKNAELGRANSELEARISKLEEMNAMFRAALEKKAKQEN